MAEQDASAPTYDSRYDEGWRCINGGDYANARTLFESLLSGRPTEPSALASLAWVYLQLGMHDQAGAVAERCRQVDPASRLARSVTADLCVRDGRWREAADLATILTREKPDDLVPHWSLARAYFGLGRYKDALAEFDYLWSMQPGVGDTAVWKIDALSRLGRYREALQLYAATPQSHDNVERLSRMAELNSGLARSLWWGERPAPPFADSWPSAPAAIWRYWINRKRIRDILEEASGYSSQAAALAPENPHVIDRHCRILMSLHHYTEVAKVCQAYIRRATPTARILASLGGSYVLNGNAGTGKEYLLRAIELDPKDLFARSALTRGYFVTGQFPKAMRMLCARWTV